LAGGGGGVGGTGGVGGVAGSGTGGADAAGGDAGIDANVDAGGADGGGVDANIDRSGDADAGIEASVDADASDVSAPDAAPDNGTPVAIDGGVFVPSNARSCGQPDGGPLLCNGESCCTSINLPGGMFPQGRSTDAGASDYFPSGAPDELPEFSSTLSSFALDKYEITVGRFRNFVEAYVGNGVDGGAATVPLAGDGANPNIAGSGWQTAWNTYLPADQAAFKDTSHLNKYIAGYGTWTDTAGANENKAINSVSWYEVLAFCIWDGGRIATESEWEYAAAGGSENRLYPWGSGASNCTDENRPGCFGAVAAVGSGSGRWGHADLAGNVWEWTMDWYGPYPTTATNNYAGASSGAYRVIRGGCFADSAEYHRAAFRNGFTDGPAAHNNVVGARCARTPQ
jgi:formylglycine-generating enzyme required for sulfatase activity